MRLVFARARMAAQPRLSGIVALVPLERLSVTNYRSIRRLELALGPVNVFVGPNGSGKTNLYRSLELLAAAAGGGLSRMLADEGGIPSAVWAGKRGKEAVRVEVLVGFDDLEFSLSLGPQPPVPGGSPLFLLDPEVKEERAWVRDGTRRHLVLERRDRTAFLRDAEGTRVTFPLALWSGESVLAQLAEPHRFPLLSSLRARFQDWRFHHHFDTSPGSAIREPQVGIRTPVLAHDGRDLAAALETIRDIGDAKSLARHIADAFDGARLDVQAPEARFDFTLEMPGLLRPLHARELSDGTLRYLCLVAALLSPRPPALFVLNEPETSLHPDLLSPLAGLIVQASERSQVVLTTHAEALAQDVARLARTSPIRLQKSGAETVVAEAGS